MIPVLLLLCQATTGHGQDPGPRSAVAGLAGFQVESRLDFGEQSNRLTVAYTFPDRARWHFESYTARVRSEHQYFYRLGGRLRAFDGSPSRELQGDEREGLLLQMELRRAVLLWPDGFDWEEAGPGSRTARVNVDSCCREGNLGTLVASLQGGRLERAEVRDRTGKAIEAMEIRAWQEVAGRPWPRTLVMKGEQGSFTETVESIDTQVHFLEVSFLPPDQRPVLASSDQGPRIQARDIVSMTHSARPLPAGTSWVEAERMARERIETARGELAQLGLELDPVPMLELDQDGRPVCLLLRLSAPRRPPPEGFTTIPERPGLFLLAGDTKEVEARLLRRLLASVPAGARPGTPYVRLHDRKEVPVEIVLPIEPDR